MVCLLCSTLFHTMSAHSEWVSNVFSRLDYVGIAVLIVGSSLTWLYYGFYCEFYTKLTYMVAVSIMGVLTGIKISQRIRISQSLDSLQAFWDAPVSQALSFFMCKFHKIPFVLQPS